MADDRTLKILLQIQSDIEGLQKVKGGVDDVKKSLGEASSAGSAFGTALQFGAGIEIVHQLGNALAEIPRRFIEALQEGVAFNALLETTRIGIAGVLRQFDPSTYKSFNAALGDSNELVELLRQKANQLGLSFEAMLEQYKTTAGALFSGGVRDLQKQVDLTVLLQQAMAALGITAFQAQRDIFDILEGRSSRTIAGKALGISDEDVTRAKEAGTLYEFLTTKFQSLSVAGAAIGQTFGAAEQRTKNLAQQLEGIASRDIFGALKEGLESLNNELGARDTGEKIAGIMNVGIGALKGLAEAGSFVVTSFKQMNDNMEAALHTQELLNRIIPASPLQSLFDVGAARQFVTAETAIENSLLNQIRSATTLKEQSDARKALDAEIVTLQDKVANSTGQTHEVAEQFLHSLQQIASLFPSIVGSAEQTAHAMATSAEQAEKLIKAAEAVQSVESKIAVIQAEASGNQSRILTAKQEEVRLATQRSLMEKGVDPLTAAREAETLAAATRDKAEHEADAKSSAQGARDAHREITAFTREESALLAGIRQQQSLVTGNPFLTDEQKNAQLLPLITQEIAQQNAVIADGKAKLVGGTLDPATYEQVAAKIQQAGFTVDQLRQKLSTLNFAGGFQASMVQWANSFGTIAQQAAGVLQNTLGTAINSVSQGITGLITRTGNWRQSVAQAATAVIQSLVRVGLQMLVQATLGRVLSRANAQEQTAAGLQIAAANAPAAAATSIASYGGAAVSGAAAAAAAIAAIIGALAGGGGGFHEGGFTGGVEGRAAGVVHGEEFVFSAPATRTIGAQNLDWLHKATVSGPSYAAGGYVAPTSFASQSRSSGAGSKAPEIHIFALYDTDSLRKMVMNSDAAHKIIFDAVRGRRLELGIG